MNVDGATALVTGSNRGLGAGLVMALLEAGCRRVYAGARQIESVVAAPGVIPLRLDITRPEEVAAAAARCGDVDLLINNAGVARFTPAIAVDGIDNARAEMETNYFGTLAMCRAFAPVLKANGGGALINVLSVVSWFNVPMQGTYCASKSASWSLTKAIRVELRRQGTRVMGVYAGYIDTDMTAGVAFAKSSPAAIASAVLAGIAADEEDILADERALTLHAQLLGDYRTLEASMQTTWDALKERQTL